MPVRRMKISILLTLLLTCGQTSAGPLDPPAGPPTSTFKTLGEVEPRRAVQSLPGDSTALHVISQPGSYYLTGNITGVTGKHGILIAADNVTLDLGGFTVRGVSGSASGIVCNFIVKGVRVQNGTVSNWAIANVGLEAQSCSISGISVHGGGIGIASSQSTVITNCAVSSVGGAGFVAGPGSTLTDCTVRTAGGVGFQVGTGSTLNRCSALMSTTGFQSGIGSTLVGCTAQENSIGFSGSGITLQQCVAYGNTSHGFSIGSNCVMENCSARENAGKGVSAGDGLTMNACNVNRNNGGGAQVGAASAITASIFSFNNLFGIALGNSCSISRCTASFNVGSGIFASAWSTINDNNCLSNDGSAACGIRASSAGNRIEGNSLNDNLVGIILEGPGNMVIRNSFTFNPTRIQAVAGNNIGAMLITPGDNFASTNPFANLAY